ncbi:MAG TPA: hypothetical protein VND96_10840 [Candidatus Micrarchaeaceae archaeon]|nr:hypothetical protein [Candidatus Micrarchaeaceae archaeon]
MIAFVGLLVFGLALFVAGVVSDSRPLRGAGVLFALCGSFFAVALAVRWLIYRGIG